MYSKFDVLPDEKKNKILNAAMAEFSKNGYKAASTDSMAVASGISKGSLFAYFGTKKQLYLYLHNHVLEKMIKNFLEVFTPDKDFLQRMLGAVTIKFKMLKEDPALFDYLMSMIYEKDSEIEPDIRESNAKLLQMTRGVLSANYDKTLFRGDIDADCAMNIIRWTLDGYSQIEQAKIRKLGISSPQVDFEAMYAELNKYMEILRKLLYKE